MRSAALLALAGSGCLAALHVTTTATVTTDATAPAFALPSQDGHVVSLASELAHGPVVLVFYRGYW
jgi:hypothetical protein